MKKSEETGIYHLSNSETGELYIGSGVLQARRIQHFSDLRNNRHCNSLLQEVYNRNPNFEFKIIAKCDKETALNLEQIALDASVEDSTSLNVSKKARGCAVEPSSEQIENYRKRMLGNTYNLGRKLEPEHKAKVLAALQPSIVEKSRPVTIEGQVFVSIHEASRQLGIPKTTIFNRIKSPNSKFDNWKDSVD